MAGVGVLGLRGLTGGGFWLGFCGCVSAAGYVDHVVWATNLEALIMRVVPLGLDEILRR